MNRPVILNIDKCELYDIYNIENNAMANFITEKYKKYIQRALQLCELIDGDILPYFSYDNLFDVEKDILTIETNSNVIINIETKNQDSDNIMLYNSENSLSPSELTEDVEKNFNKLENKCNDKIIIACNKNHYADFRKNICRENSCLIISKVEHLIPYYYRWEKKNILSLVNIKQSHKVSYLEHLIDLPTNIIEIFNSIIALMKDVTIINELEYIKCDINDFININLAIIDKKNNLYYEFLKNTFLVIQQYIAQENEDDTSDEESVTLSDTYNNLTDVLTKNMLSCIDKNYNIIKELKDFNIMRDLCYDKINEIKTYVDRIKLNCDKNILLCYEYCIRLCDFRELLQYSLKQLSMEHVGEKLPIYCIISDIEKHNQVTKWFETRLGEKANHYEFVPTYESMKKLFIMIYEFGYINTDNISQSSIQNFWPEYIAQHKLVLVQSIASEKKDDKIDHYILYLYFSLLIICIWLYKYFI